MSSVPVPIVDMVVAHYNEDLSWIEAVRPFVRLFIYHKGNNPENKDFIMLKNVGREAHTFLTHIINNYDNLADITLFMQGRISDHFYGDGIFDTYTFVEMLVRGALKNGNSCNMSHIPTNCSGYSQLRPLAVPGVKFGKENFAQWLKRVLDMDMPTEGLIWYIGAIMCIHRKLIHSRSLAFYKELLKEVDHDIHPEEAHFFERAWYYIFKCHENEMHKNICEDIKNLHTKDNHST